LIFTPLSSFESLNRVIRAFTPSGTPGNCDTIPSAATVILDPSNPRTLRTAPASPPPDALTTTPVSRVSTKPRCAPFRNRCFIAGLPPGSDADVRQVEPRRAARGRAVPDQQASRVPGGDAYVRSCRSRRLRRGRGACGPPGELAGPAGARCGDQRTVRKKVRRSSTNSSGCSIAAKWPPRGISAQWVTLYRRSTHERGKGSTSLG